MTDVLNTWIIIMWVQFPITYDILKHALYTSHGAGGESENCFGSRYSGSRLSYESHPLQDAKESLRFSSK